MTIKFIHNQLIVKADKLIPRAGEGSAVLLKNDSIMLVYCQFAGKEDHNRASIVSRISTDGGISWSLAREIIKKNPESLNVMSPGLLRLDNGRLALVYIEKFSLTDCTPCICFSDDEGESWSEPSLITKRGRYNVVVNDRLIQTSGGRLLIPAAVHSYNEADGSWNNTNLCIVYYSDDCGLSWNQSNYLDGIKPSDAAIPHNLTEDKRAIWETILQEGICTQEPGLVELSDGKIMLWTRTAGGYMYRSISQDNGETWSAFKPVTSIISPLAPQSIKRLPGSSRLICFYNDRRGESFLIDNWSWRTPLTVATSDDDGKTWSALGNIESTDHNYCYTSILFFAGKLLLTYYYSENYIENNLEKRRNLASLKLQIIKF